MFKKFSGLPDPNERLEIFNLLKFNLAVCRRVIEFLTLAALVAGFGWLIGQPAAPRPSPLYSAPLIALALLISALPRWLFMVIESALAADFGLDPRPVRQRLAALAAREIRWLAAVWLFSVIIFQILTVTELWAWTLIALAAGAGLLFLDACRPGLLRPERPRPPQAGELDPALTERLDNWARQMGFKPWPIRIDTSFSPYLTTPHLSGFGSTQTLVIPEKALSAFTPRALALLTVSAMVEGLAKAPLKFIFLRGCALAVASPLAAILICTLGARMWFYPILHNPALVILIWLAGWLGLALADFTTRIVRRDLEAQLASAAALILKDDEAVDAARTTLALKNLEEEAPPAWRDWFSPRYGRPAFLKRCQHYRGLNANAAPFPPQNT